MLLNEMKSCTFHCNSPRTGATEGAVFVKTRFKIGMSITFGIPVASDLFLKTQVAQDVCRYNRNVRDVEKIKKLIESPLIFGTMKVEGDLLIPASFRLNLFHVYALKRRIGEGSTGNVYLYQHVDLKTTAEPFLTLKVFKARMQNMPDYAATERDVLKEFKLKLNMGEDFVVSRYVEKVNRPYILMEAFDGDLEPLVSKLNFKESVALTIKCFRVLKTIYDKTGLLTADIKFENFLYSCRARGDDPSLWTIVVSDYGGFAKEGTTGFLRSMVIAEDVLGNTLSQKVFLQGLAFFMLQLFEGTDHNLYNIFAREKYALEMMKKEKKLYSEIFNENYKKWRDTYIAQNPRSSFFFETFKNFLTCSTIQEFEQKFSVEA